MAQPVFLSYSWSDLDDVDVLDGLLRWRGVPVWRDRRAMAFGQYQEDEARRALREDCSGFALYLTEDALQSPFINGIELPAMDSRRAQDDHFFAGAVFRDWGFENGQRKVHERCGVVLSAARGGRVNASAPLPAQLTETANSILTTYLARQRPAGPAEIVIDTRADIPWRADGLLHLAWSPPLSHRLDDYDSECWQRDLLPALHDTRIALENAGDDRAIRVQGRAHLSAALALGHEFRLPTQWAMEISDQDGAAWTASATEPDLQGWQTDARPGPTADGGILVCAVSASQDIASYVRQHRTTLPVARATMNASPPNGAGGQSVDPQSANALAAGIADRIRAARNEYGTTETHVYLACPWPLAALLGWHLSSSGPIVSFEATEDRSSYVRACRLT
jgi:hypothetical protein